METRVHVGKVIKHVSPERCVFLKMDAYEKSGTYPLNPGNYVEILRERVVDGQWIRTNIPAIIEKLTGDSSLIDYGYIYECRAFAGQNTYELLDKAVFVPQGATLVRFFDPASRYPLHIGELEGIEEHVPVILRGENLLGTHSCIFGTSGSGKTTLLGLLIEEILLNLSDAQVIVLDLNSDFVKFDQKRSEAEVNSDDNPCQKIEAIALRSRQEILGKLPKKLIPSPEIRMNRFSPSDLLQLESIPHHFATEECLETLYQSLSGTGPITPRKCEEELRRVIEHEKTDLALAATRATYPLQEEELKGRRILHNFFMRVKDAPLWSSDSNDSLNMLENVDAFRFIQFNLGGLRFAHRAILAEAVFKRLWERNEKTKRPTFLIIDEAHNVAPAMPEEAWQRRTVEWVNRISGEGRKYGLYLILVSQRPAKIHSNALDNCRNFFILRLENRDDLDSLSRRTVEVSESLLSRAATFRKHQALLFGDLCPPAIIHPGRRRMK